MATESGFPGSPTNVAHPMNPTLIPNFDQAVVATPGVTVPTIPLLSPAAMLEAVAAAAATGSFTVGGTVTSGNVITLAFANPALPGGVYHLVFTVTTETTVAEVAAGLAAAIGKDPVLNAFRISAAVDEAVPAQVDVTQESVVGNYTTMSYAAGSNTETLTFAASGKLAGGAGLVTPYNNFEFAFNSQIFAFWIGKPVAVDYRLLSAMMVAGVPIR